MTKGKENNQPVTRCDCTEGFRYTEKRGYVPCEKCEGTGYRGLKP